MSKVHERLQQLIRMRDNFCVAGKDNGHPSKWIPIKEINAPADSFFFRQQLENEIILELDESTLEENRQLYERIKPMLVATGMAFEAWTTQSKSYHIHIFFDRSLTDNERQAFIKSTFEPEETVGMDSNYWTKNARQLVAIGGAIHYKSGKPKILIEALGEGLNKFPDIPVPERKKENGFSKPKVDKSLNELLKDKNPTEQERSSCVMKIHNLHNEWNPEQINDHLSTECRWQDYDPAISLKKIEGLLKAYGTKEASTDALTFLAMGKRRQATETLVQEILSKNHIYTTRDDEKSEIWIYREGIYIPQGRTFIREHCRKSLGEAYTTTLSNETIAKIEADTYIDQEKFFENENIEEIAVENGILNIMTKKLNEFTPEKRFFNKLPVKYEPAAACPATKKHFETVLKYKEDLPIIEELFGYLLLREYKFEKAFMLIGEGRNGKGKSIMLMKRFIGVENCSSVELQNFEEDNYAKGELFKKMANLCGDLSKTALKNTGTFKELTGRDLISANRKFLPHIKFTNYAKLVFACNELPLTYDLTIAFFARWIILEFPYTFVSQEECNKAAEEERKNLKIEDPDIIQKISTPQELSGLLNMALEGLHRLLQQKEFSNSKSTQETQKTWLRKSSSFNAFYMDCAEENEEETTSKADMRKAYAAYCRQHKLKPASDKTIKNILSLKGIGESREPDGHWYWEGIKLKNETKNCKDCKDSNGFPPQLNNQKMAIEWEMGANLANLAKNDKKQGTLEEFQ